MSKLDFIDARSFKYFTTHLHKYRRKITDIVNRISHAVFNKFKSQIHLFCSLWSCSAPISPLYEIKDIQQLKWTTIVEM
jgi:hypothetical protein